MAGRRIRLTDAAVERLRPREKEFAVWDDRVLATAQKCAYSMKFRV